MSRLSIIDELLNGSFAVPEDMKEFQLYIFVFAQNEGIFWIYCHFFTKRLTNVDPFMTIEKNGYEI